MTIYPVSISLSEKFWREELEHQDLPKDLIILLRDLIGNYLEKEAPALWSRKVAEMAKNEIEYLIIGGKRYVIKTQQYLHGDFLFFLSPAQ